MSERHDDRSERADTRGRMIDTALAIVAERGYEGMSLQMVADATDVTKAAVYYHFRTKSDLLEAILQRLFADAPPVPEPALLRSRRARLTWAAEQILQTLTHYRKVIYVINGDPIIRKHPTFTLLVEDTRKQAMSIVYGEHPTRQDVAAFHLATCAVHTLPELTELTDDELLAALRPAVYRTLGLPASAGGNASETRIPLPTR